MKPFVLPFLFALVPVRYVPGGQSVPGGSSGPPAVVPWGLEPSTAAPAGGVVHLELSSPQAASTVQPGDRIDWLLTTHVSTEDNLGLALISVDIGQSPDNPELFDLPRGTGISPVMRAFDRPRGFANPGVIPEESGYRGTPVGKLGERNLAQIGGAQNTFGVTGPCLGPNGEICTGQDVVVTPGVGQSAEGQLIALGSFLAPATPGSYDFQITSAVATTLHEIATPPAPSVVRRARVQLAVPGFRFNVQ